ncbi:hypothetical protein BDN72DRAFT_860792 [Pluteus cervinus]|uniref:Uncharacterized protein n=1 Tax=Pluteus cervinus TaxID=181527 RepID=A0ACD3AH44_9AGAR|nr:hypothetical protein BDN72DRAFT_860792 [Pluteus cervinus]
MTEYDFSPEAVSRYHAKMSSITDWTYEVSDKAELGNIGPPPTPLTRRQEIDDTQEVARLRRWERDLKREKERERKEWEKERERLKEQARREKTRHREPEPPRDRKREDGHHDRARRSKSHGHRSERSPSRERDKDRDRDRERGHRTDSKKSGAHRESSRHHRDKRSQTAGPYSNSSQSTKDVTSTQTLVQPAPQHSTTSLPVYHRHTLSPHAVPNPPARHTSTTPPPSRSPPRALRPQTTRSRTTPHPLSHQIQFIQPPPAVRSNTAPVIPGQPEKSLPPAVAIPIPMPAPVPRQVAPRPIIVNGQLVHPHANPRQVTYTPPPPNGYVFLPAKNGKVQAVATPPPQPYPSPPQPTKSHALSLLARLLKPRRNSVTSADSKSSRGDSLSPTHSELPSRSKRRGSIP